MLHARVQVHPQQQQQTRNASKQDTKTRQATLHTNTSPTMDDTTKQLHDACQSGKYDEVRTLVKAGADVNATIEGLTAIQAATVVYERRIVGLLLSMHESQTCEIVDLRDSFGDNLDSILVTAAKMEWVDILQRVIDMGAYETKDLHVATLSAISAGRFESVLVLDKYVDMDGEVGAEYMRTALDCDQLRIVDFLVKKQVPGHKRVKFGW